ncbi:hypothetical protein AJ79_03123 [Helicocarpus griseus UAMH5409]|uniref:Uncharacterized protein n=1 Tax=Helicocarpus griseus UAMH5409 TaxID=1447875 RepID=A0A2B7XZU9_9EURO|nr:hypothetical protein AJ79_03123 [Helicocarpus griseus UAMH5409]
MPTTTVIYYQDEFWYMRTLAQVEPPFPIFVFAGEDEAARAAAVQELGNLMQANDVTAMMDRFPTMFPEQIEEFNAQEIMNISFSWADSMIIPGQFTPITAESFGVAEVDEALPEFAELLLAFFGLVRRKDESKQIRLRLAQAMDTYAPGLGKSLFEPNDSYVYTMTFENLTDKTFKFCWWDPANLGPGSSIISQPSGDLIAGGGQTFSWYQMFGEGGHDTLYGSTGFFTPEETHTIGIQIIVPFQALGIGRAPYYQVAVSSSFTGEFTSQSYLYPRSYGYSIFCNPTASHTSLYVKVTINHLSEKIAERSKLPPPKLGQALFPEREETIRKEWAERAKRR